MDASRGTDVATRNIHIHSFAQEFSDMFRTTSSIGTALAGGLTLLAGAPTSADVTLTSTDGRWVATIEDSGGAAGQCNGLKDNNAAPAYQNFLPNSRHYVRMGTAISYANAVSQRMENIFSLVSFANTSDTFTATLKCDSVAGLIAIVHGEMVSGAAGGLRVSLSFADTDPSGIILGQYSVKPFVYANMNVDGQMISNEGGWAADHFHQHANNTGTGNIRWFRGRSPAAHASNHDSFMQSALDNGVAELGNTAWMGPGDINCALSFAAGGLGAGDVHTIAYAVGNQNISIPAGFGLPPNSGGVAIQSSDDRWSATVRTGLGTTNLGSAGEIGEVYDFNMPLNASRFVTSANYFLGVSPNSEFIGQRIRDTFERVTFFYPTETVSMASAVLNSTEYPGLVLIIDARMLAGPDGGLVVSMKYADLLGRQLNLAPVVFADIDCDNQTNDTGGLDGDHFYQQGPGLSPQRWFKVQQGTFSSYQSGNAGIIQAWLATGVTSLNNLIDDGPGNIGACFAFHPWPLNADNVYATGYALGDAGIVIPSSFVNPSVWYACPADVAPAPLGDGHVNVDDLIAVILDWGMCQKGGECSGDIVPTYLGDGFVNVDDLIEVIINWGECNPE
jgi:hypothetical protein